MLQHFFLSFHAARKTGARNSFCFLQGIYLYGILTNHRSEAPYIMCIRPFLEFQRSMVKKFPPSSFMTDIECFKRSQMNSRISNTAC